MLLTLLNIGVTLVAIWIGVRKITLHRWWAFGFALGEFALLLVSIAALGPLMGSLLAVVGLVVWLLIASVRAAMEYESVIADAAVHWRASTPEAKATVEAIRAQDARAFGHLGMLGTARLVAALAKCARSQEEAAEMARPLALLGVVFRLNPEELALPIDRLMRRTGTPATDAMRVANTLTASAQRTPGSIEALLEFSEALLAESPK